MSEFIPQQYDATPPEPQNSSPNPRKGLAIASLVLGILTVLLLFTIVLPIITGILAVVFGLLSIKGSKKGMAIAGLATGGAGLLLVILIIVIATFGVLNFHSSELQNTLLNDLGITTIQEIETTINDEQALLNSGEAQAFSMKRVGNAAHGFFDIPIEWVEFRTIGVDSEIVNIIQYSDMTGTDIITVQYLAAPEDFSFEEYMGVLALGMQNMGAAEVDGAAVDFNGFNALQIYGFWADHTAMVTWGFERGDQIHIISVEGPFDSILRTAYFMETSFSFEP